MPVPKGVRVGGRKLGTPNKVKRFDVAATAERMKCDPFEVLCMIAKGTLPCSVCFGTGRTKYKTKYKTRNSIRERVCESCYGTLREKVSPGDRLRASEALGRKLAPDLRAIEMSGSLGLSLADTIRQRRALRASQSAQLEGANASLGN